MSGDDVTERCEVCDWDMPRSALDLHETFDVAWEDSDRVPEPITVWRCKDLAACQHRRRYGRPE